MNRLNRWVYAVVGTIVLLFAGLIYAWSVLSSPIKEEFINWSAAQLSLTFTIVMTMFCLGGLVGGLLSNKINIKINVWISAILFLIGFYLASKTTTLVGLYIGFGILAGFASGLAYNAVMSTMSKWFPDKQGLISGILLMGFGLGSFIIGKVYQAYTPVEIGGWRTSFMFFGILLFIVIGIGGFFFVKPGDDFIPPGSIKKKKISEEGMDVNVLFTIKRLVCRLFWGWSISPNGAGLSLISQSKGVAVKVEPQYDLGNVVTDDFIPLESIKKKKMLEKGMDVNALVMIKRPAFWLFFGWSTLLNGAGLALISQAKGVAMEAGPQLDLGTIATMVGLISIFNGVGRVVYGGLFDKIGRGKTMWTINIVFLISVGILILAFLNKSFLLMGLGFMCCGFSYGGIPTTGSAFINSFYGSTHYSVNFPIVNLNLIIASFGSTIAGGLYDISGSYFTTFLFMIGAVIIGFICLLGIKKP